MDDIIQEKEVLKKYFQTGDKPTEIQYRNLIHSLRHKHDKIGLQDLNLQGYDEEGERDNSLIVRLGDFVDSSNGTKIVITDDNQEIQISGRLVTDSDINAFGQTIAAGSVIVDNTLNIDGTGNFSGTLNSNGNLNVRGDYLALKMNEDRHNAYMNIWQRLSANDITFRYIDNGDGLGNVDSLRLKRSGEAIFPTDVIANRFVGDGSQLTNLPTQAPANTAYTDSDNNFSSAQTFNGNLIANGDFLVTDGDTNRLETEDLGLIVKGNWATRITLDSASGNDAVISLDENGVQKAKLGFDSSDNLFKIISGTGPFSDNTFTLDASGNSTQSGGATFAGQLDADLGAFDQVQVGVNNSSATNNKINIYSTNDGDHAPSNVDVGSEIIMRNLSTENGNFSAVSGYNSNNLVTSRIAFVNQDISNRHGRISFMTHNGASLGERLNIRTSSVGVSTNFDVTGTSTFTGTVKVDDTLKLGSSTGTNALNSGTLDFLEDIDHNFGGADGHGFRLTYNGDGNLFELKGGNRTSTNTIFSVSRDNGEFNFYRDLKLNEGHQNITSHWYKRSIYHATNGILIETDASTSADKMIELIIEGNSYANRNISGPIISRVQAYNYATAGTIVNSGALTNDPNFTIDVFHYNGKVYFWFEQTNTFQTYSFKTNAGVGSSPVKIVNVTNAVKPTTGVTNNVSITPIQILTSASISFEDIPDRPIWNWGTERSDITGLTGGSVFGTIYEGTATGHIAVGIRGNDSGDSFWIFETEDGMDGLDTYTKAILRVNDTYFQYKGNDVVHTGNIISTLQNSFITISTDQTITGEKTFTQNVNMQIAKPVYTYLNGYDSASPVIGVKGKASGQSFFIAEQSDNNVRMMDMVETSNGAYQRWYNNGVETIRINGELGDIETQDLKASQSVTIESSNPTIVLKETDVTDQNIDIQLNSGQLKIFGVNDARDSFNEWVTVNASNGLLSANAGIDVLSNGNTSADDIINLFSQDQTRRFKFRADGVLSWGSNIDSGSGNNGSLSWDTGYVSIISHNSKDLKLISGSGTIIADDNIDATGKNLKAREFEFGLDGGTITTSLLRNPASGGMVMDTNSPVGSNTDLLSIRSGATDQFLVKGNGAGWFAGDVTASEIKAVNGSEDTKLAYFGLEFNRITNYLRPTSNNDKYLYIGGFSPRDLNWNTIHFHAGNSEFYSPVFIEETLKIGSTSTTGELQFFDTSSTPQASLHYDEGASEMVYQNLENTAHRFIADVSMNDDLFVQGKISANELRITGLNTAPTSSTDTGNTGEIRYTADHMYVCTATNTWKRVALSTW